MDQKFSNSLNFYSSGKLMLTGEYLVLAGVLSLALPTKLGQYMRVIEIEEPVIDWTATVKGRDWFSARFNLNDIEVLSSTLNDKASILQDILRTARKLNPDFLKEKVGYKVETNLEFDLDWGLGSSSTLISNVAYWAQCDPYKLNKRIFRGSGYDIACARSAKPLLYRLSADNNTEIGPVDFIPSFADRLYFVWLNRKQDTREGIGRFDKTADHRNAISKINAITSEIVCANELHTFQQLIHDHEEVVSNVLKVKSVQEELFSDFEGAVKSLGAWGGDFVLAATNLSFEEVKKYFKQKGYPTVLRYLEIIK